MIRTATFSGKRWRIVADEHVDGYVDAPEFADDERELYISAGLKGRRRLEVCVHEALHACHGGLPEKEVDGIARDVARFLWRLGYRASTGD